MRVTILTHYPARNGESQAIFAISATSYYIIIGNSKKSINETRAHNIFNVFFIYIFMKVNLNSF